MADTKTKAKSKAKSKVSGSSQAIVDGGSGSDSGSSPRVKGKAPVDKFEFAAAPDPSFNNGLRVGLMAEVISGEHEGRYGSIESDGMAYEDGIPKTCSLRTRDDNSETIVVEYTDLKPAPLGGRR